MEEIFSRKFECISMDKVNATIIKSERSKWTKVSSYSRSINVILKNPNKNL